jgi:hypothetical protein
MMMRLSSLILLVLSSSVVCGQQQDSLIVAGWLKSLSGFGATKTTTQLVLQGAKLQLGIPYKAGQLDEPENETLLLTARGVDCVLYIENAYAAALAVKTKNATVASFKEALKEMRYRNGVLDGFGSRKHYFTEWLLDQISAGRMEWVALDGAVPLQTVQFMTLNRDKYPRMKTQADFENVARSEAKINAAKIRYLPKSAVEQQLDRLQDGDVLGFVTTVGGLDVSHTAFFVRDQGKATFLHASTKGTVMLEPSGLIGYLNGRKSVSGILAARFKE